MSTKDDYSPVYSLYAVVVHNDVMNAAFSGHYVCYVKDTQGKWYKADDSQVHLLFLGISIPCFCLGLPVIINGTKLFIISSEDNLCVHSRIVYLLYGGSPCIELLSPGFI
jgi:hypothetical protein